MTDQAQILPGTLDLLILRAVSLGPLHGYGILLRIGQISGNALLIEQGALYPGRFRLVRQGLLKASWGTSENNRRAKFYELTAAGRKRLREETDNWNRLVRAIGSALAAQPEEIGSSSLLGILASRVLASIVYQASPRDPVVLAGVVLAMSLLGLLATWIPARRTLAVNPLVLLGDE
jgi:PadR family transcriptional regulator PadR